MEQKNIEENPETKIDFCFARYQILPFLVRMVSPMEEKKVVNRDLDQIKQAGCKMIPGEKETFFPCSQSLFYPVLQESCTTKLARLVKYYSMVTVDKFSLENSPILEWVSCLMLVKSDNLMAT